MNLPAMKTALKKTVPNQDQIRRRRFRSRNATETGNRESKPGFNAAQREETDISMFVARSPGRSHPKPAWPTRRQKEFKP